MAAVGVPDRFIKLEGAAKRRVKPSGCGTDAITPWLLNF
jgi:hypothetical protein